MSRENVEAFQEGVEAFNRGEMETWIDGFAEDVVFVAARSAVEGPYHGHGGLRKWLADTAASFETFELNPEEVRDLDDRVLVLGTIRIRGRGAGVETDVPVAGVATFEDGKVVRWEDFRERRLALEAVGLSA